ncbi:hypothetical protein RHIZO_01335 [Rhizobiaceae bacterium]|nr:hypothetical protein RHIZO_01335 [Rhizobiaceae bacterium]
MRHRAASRGPARLAKAGPGIDLKAERRYRAERISLLIIDCTAGFESMFR